MTISPSNDDPIIKLAFLYDFRETVFQLAHYLKNIEATQVQDIFFLNYLLFDNSTYSTAQKVFDHIIKQLGELKKQLDNGKGYDKHSNLYIKLLSLTKEFFHHSNDVKLQTYLLLQDSSLNELLARDPAAFSHVINYKFSQLISKPESQKISSMIDIILNTLQRSGNYSEKQYRTTATALVKAFIQIPQLNYILLTPKVQQELSQSKTAILSVKTLERIKHKLFSHFSWDNSQHINLEPPLKFAKIYFNNREILLPEILPQFLEFLNCKDQYILSMKFTQGISAFSQLRVKVFGKITDLIEQSFSPTTINVIYSNAQYLGNE